MAATTGYAKNGAAHIAYSVVGAGPIDVLAISTNTFSIDARDQEPHVAHFDRRLAALGRLIRYDPRGVGRSDPVDLAVPLTLENAARDVLAVLDAAGSERAVLVADDGGAGVAIVFAVMAPERVDRLVILNGYARVMTADDYPYGHPPEFVASFVDLNIDPDAEWSVDGADDRALIAPSLQDDEAFGEWWQRASAQGAGPATARAILRMTTQTDVRDQLSSVTAPTLVVHRRDNFFIPVGCGRYLGENIAGAKYVELAGADQVPYSGDADELLDEIEEFVTGRLVGGSERMLATLLFTDIVDSTGQAVALGDREWRARLETHDGIVRRQLQRYGGREVNTTGDGFLAEFTGPTSAARCARSIIDASAGARIVVRAGIHTGECERRGHDLAGLAVHIAARVAAVAGAGEVVVSRTVCDLVAGSSMRFVDRGEHDLKGVPGRWQLFALES